MPIQDGYQATGVRTNGDRDFFGVNIGASEDEAFWLQFLRWIYSTKALEQLFVELLAPEPPANAKVLSMPVPPIHRLILLLTRKHTFRYYTQDKIPTVFRDCTVTRIDY